MVKQFAPAFRLTLFLTLLTGILYPLAITGICQGLFPRQANGSLIEARGRAVGSALIGQNFTRPAYFQGRPSAAGYDGMASGGSNLGPTNKALAERVKASVEKFRKDNPDFHGAIPADLLTTSGSGLDPHLSPAAATAQAGRVAAARGVEPGALNRLIGELTEMPDFGLVGEPRVNVLLLNLALDERFPARPRAALEPR
jgi:K+-transporting ATPase ATPase C chain